jgi:uncharacterized protein (TIGR00162 family)
VIRKNKFVFNKVLGMVTSIDINKKQKLKSPILLVGLPGIGLVGKIAIDYVVNELKPKCKLFATLISDSFPPAVHSKNGILELICDEIYSYRYKNQDYLFLIGPVQPSLVTPSNSYLHYDFSETIAKFAKKMGVKKIYTFAGLNIGQDRLNKKPKVICVASDIKIKKDLQKLKIKDLVFEKDNSDTLISGVAGLLIGVAKYKFNISGCCFMGETNQKLVFGDSGSAKNVLAVISKLLPFKLDLNKINKDAKKIENSFSKITTKLKDLENKKDHPASYIR